MMKEGLTALFSLELIAMKQPDLFGRSKNGKTKFWSIETLIRDDSIVVNKTTFGYLDGKKQTTEKEYLTGKNIGRSNETTAFEQAVLEAKSLWQTQIDKGYTEDQNDIPDAKDVELFLPMLAVRYDNRAKHIKWPAVAQPKLDGVRCLACKRNGVVQLWSRRGKLFTVPTELIADLGQIMQEGDKLDGEIYTHQWNKGDGGSDHFDRIISALKKRNEDTPHLEYHIYDIPEANLSFKERFIEKDIEESDRIKKVETLIVKEDSEIQLLLERYLDLGYEGLMIRNLDSEYLFAKRSNSLQKVKVFEDEEFEIVGGKEATGKDKGTVVFICKTPDDVIFEVRPKGSKTVRTKMLKDLEDLIGQLLTVQFQGYTKAGKPRFPVGLRLRPKWDK